METSSGAPTVKIGDGGQVLQCAKGAAPSACGYKAGDAVCSACGATAVEVKMYGESDLPAEFLSKKKKKKKKPGMHMMPDGTMMADEDMPEEKTYGAPPVRAYGDFVDDEELGIEQEDEIDDLEDDMMEEPDLMEEEEMTDSIAMARSPKMKASYVEEPISESEDDEDDLLEEEMMDEDEDEEEIGMYGKSDYVDLRLASMGFKQGEMGQNPFVCAIERKIYPANSPVCENCPGGCVKEGDMPALLEIEGVAEDMFRGKVLDSGYSDKADIFVVDVERKDGKPVEAFFDGTTGECMGWHLLNDEVLNVKSGFQPTEMISFSEAAQIATKSINGDVVSVEADLFEGFDSYAVEIEGVDGKSYDVFVSLDGEVLGYDTYTQQESFAIESEAAEIALKRAYGDEVRAQMAERGDAMPDGEMPIANDSDLRNAIMSWPRSGNRTQAKEHIMARAKVLGLEKSLPDEWLQQKQQNEQAQGDANFMSSLAEFEMIANEVNSTNTEKDEHLALKAMHGDDEHMDKTKGGMAMPDGSYPIMNEDDLKAAIMSYGSATDPNAVKMHCMNRAKEMGKDYLIPENWK